MRTYNMGVIYAVPAGANPTPIQIGSIKGAKVGIKQAKKSFRGQFRDVIDVGDGARDWPVEIEMADFHGTALQLMIAGVSPVSGARQIVLTETGVIPTTPFQVTVAQATLFTEDAGVYDLTVGKRLTRGATSTGTGIYAVAAGVYTFNTADTGHTVLITYAYTPTSPVQGRTTTVNNTIMGQSTPYKLRLYNPFTGPLGNVRLIGHDYPSVHFEDLELTYKTEDFGAAQLKGFATQDMLGGTLQTSVFYDSEVG